MLVVNRKVAHYEKKSFVYDFLKVIRFCNDTCLYFVFSTIENILNCRALWEFNFA